MSSSRAASFRLLFGRIPFLVVWVVAPFGMPTCLFESLFVGICGSFCRQKLDVAAESMTAVCLRMFLFRNFRAHFLAILFVNLKVVQDAG